MTNKEKSFVDYVKKEIAPELYEMGFTDWSADQSVVVLSYMLDLEEVSFVLYITPLTISISQSCGQHIKWSNFRTVFKIWTKDCNNSIGEAWKQAKQFLLGEE